MTDDQRRQALFEGQLFAFSPRPAMAAFCAFAREMIEEAFAPLDPPEAQHTLPVEHFAAILADLKPRFIHHPRSKELLRQALEEFGCDVSKTYFDVPRLRSMAHKDYLTKGIAYAFEPHRDTWFSAPLCQLNWWVPVYDVQPENVMAFHPRFWSQPVRNSSNGYNYYEWNKTSRKTAAQYIKSDPRKMPEIEEEVDLDPQVRLVTNVGAPIIFSGAQLHSTVPNTSGRTRFSIDFRTAHLDDLVNRQGAPNLDSACTGTTLRDFLRATDFSPLPDEIIAMYDDETSQGLTEGLVFRPTVAQAAR
jgi:hypothetical protein